MATAPRAADRSTVSWVFLSEVTFDGHVVDVVVPEPATFLLAAGGLIVAGLLRPFNSLTICARCE